MSIAAPIRVDDALESLLGVESARLREAILSVLNPSLDSATAGLSEADELTDDLWERLAARPWQLLGTSPADGDGLGIARLTVATEALASARQTYLMPLLLSALPCVALLTDGSPDQRERFVSPVRRGAARAAFALTEPDAGSDVSATGTTAVRRGNEYVLSGRKAWISIPARADWLLVFARRGDAVDARDLSCFVVEGDARGLSVTPRPPGLGMRAVPLCDVVLEDVAVPESQRIGDDGAGFGIAMRALNAVRPIVAARGLGLTASVLMAAARHVEDRRAFGGTLKDLQLVRASIGSLAARLEGARLLTYRAARLVDTAGPGKASAPTVAAAKLLATELAVDAATTCLHLAGAAGYAEDLPFGRAVRDAQQLTIVEGTSEVQLELVARGVFERLLWWDRDAAR